MRSDFKYLGIGLAAGAGLTALVIMGMIFLPGIYPASPATPGQPSPAATQPPIHITPSTATATPTSLATITPYPTIYLSSTATLSSTGVMIESGNLVFTGALSEDKQILLYESSLAYIAPSPQEGQAMARKINGVKYGGADSTCGPLTLAIMRDAGLVDKDVIPHDFWLLNPWLEDDREFLDRTLPSDKFEHHVFYDWMVDFDWRAFPLKPGDFLYIHAGGGGNFDHMLVVNRVDSQLRAYSVTNYQRPDGFVIDEVLLYDPDDSETGILNTWAERPFAESGSTGFGGFEVWRPKPP